MLGCTTTDDVTATGLNADIGASYSHLSGTSASAACVRHKGQGPQYGAGKDWTCTLTSGSDSSGASNATAYSVTARPNGCYTATNSLTGPVVRGPANLGRDALLASFDGCLTA